MSINNTNDNETASQNPPRQTMAIIPANYQLPQNPLITIEPSNIFSVLIFKDLWDYRELLYILAAKDIKIRYKQTILGVTWALLQPLFTMLIFSFIFGRLAVMPSDGIQYPLFVYVGLLIWGFFSNAIIKSSSSLVNNSNLITKIYFPRMIVPISMVIAGFIDLLVAGCLLIPLMIYYGVGISLNILMLPVLIVLTSVLAIGLGLWTAGLNVKYRDVGQILPFLVQFGFFISPIVYPLSVIPEKWRWIMIINPMTGLIEGFRAAVFGLPFNWLALIVSALVTIVILLFTVYAFSRMEDEFADII